MVWGMIRPLVNENTQKKVRLFFLLLFSHAPFPSHTPTHPPPYQKVKIVSKRDTFAAISEFVEPDQIPVEYGGSLRFGSEDDSCRWGCPEEVQLREHVHAVNQRFRDARAAAGIPEPARHEPTSGL